MLPRVVDAMFARLARPVLPGLVPDDDDIPEEASSLDDGIDAIDTVLPTGEAGPCASSVCVIAFTSRRCGGDAFLCTRARIRACNCTEQNVTCSGDNTCTFAGI